ncbi:protein PAXX isoform 1-T1 [Discoglossus pictus]
MDGQRRTPLCTLGQDGRVYLCHSSPGGRGSGGLRIHVTDAVDVWSADVSDETLEEWNTSSSPSAPMKSTERLRMFFQSGPPLLEVQGSSATMTVPMDSGNVTLDLFKLPISEARPHVQGLMFDLANQVMDLEKNLKASDGNSSTSSSPIKPTQHFNQAILFPEVDARKQGYGASASQVKKRLPGESLINPGCKSKKKAKGVAFEDV